MEREPTFPINPWNHFHDAADGLIRTTNAVDGWPLGVTALFQGSHPTVSVFLEKIQLDVMNQEFNILKANSGVRNL